MAKTMTKELTVTELKEKLQELEKEGYSDYPVCFGYDSNFGFTSPSPHYKIQVGGYTEGVYFFERDEY